MFITDDYVLLIFSGTCNCFLYSFNLRLFIPNIFLTVFTSCYQQQIHVTTLKVCYLSICFSGDSPEVARDSTLPSTGDIQVTNSADIHQMKVSLSPLICNLPSSQPETCNGNLESRSIYFDCIINLSGLCRWACAIGYQEIYLLPNADSTLCKTYFISGQSYEYFKNKMLPLLALSNGLN